MIKRIKTLLDRDKAKDIIIERGFCFCPTCGMALRLKMREETFCSFCGQKLIRNPAKEAVNKIPVIKLDARGSRK